MLYMLYHRARGYLRVRVRMQKPQRSLSYLLSRGIRFFNIRAEDASTLTFCVSLRDRAAVSDVFALLQSRYRAECDFAFAGVPAFYKRHAHRYGLLFGIVFGIFLLYLSTFFIWSVTIDTDSAALSDLEIYAALEKVGVHAGMSIFDLDERGMQTAFLKDNPAFVFAAFNRNGTDLVACLRARSLPPENQTRRAPSHVVAAAAGVIVSVKAPSGELLVAPGDAVEEGDLLVSGALSLKNGGYRIVHSEATVVAQTFENFSVSVPISEEVLQYTGREREIGAVRVLGADLLGSVYRAPYASCTSIEDLSQASLFGLRLPFYRHSVTYAQTETKTVTRTAKRAEDLCYDAYRAFLSELLGEEGTLDEERLQITANEDAVRLEAQLLCTRDIAVQREFSYEELTG